MATTPTLDIEIYKGISYSLEFQINIRDEDGTLVGPFDLTGYELVMYVNGLLGTEVSWSSNDPIDADGSYIAIAIDPTLGQYSINLSAVTLTPLKLNVGTWRIVRKPDPLNAQILFTGTITVKSFTTDGRV